MTNWLKPVRVVSMIRVRLCLRELRDMRRERDRDRVTWPTESYISSWWPERWSAGRSPWWWDGRCRWWGTSWDWRGSRGWRSSPGRTSAQRSARHQAWVFQSKSPSRGWECGTPSPGPANNNNRQLSHQIVLTTPACSIITRTEQTTMLRRQRQRKNSLPHRPEGYLESW